MTSRQLAGASQPGRRDRRRRSHIAPRETDGVRALIRQVVADLGPKASIGLVFTSGGPGQEVSDDRAEVFQAIQKFTGQRRDPRLGGGGGFGDPGFWDDHALFKTLEDVAKMLGVEVERRKAFILISPGLPINVAGLFDTMQARPAAPAPMLREGPMGSGPNRQAFDDIALLDMMDAMRRANVATYAISTRAATTPIDPGFLMGDSITRTGPPAREPGTLTAGLLWDQPAYRARDFLSEIARASGGFALVDRAGFADGLLRLADDLDHYYMLGFYPDDAGKKWRNLDVQVNRPDVTLRFRRGYQLGAVTRPPKNKDPMVGFSASVLPKTDLPLKMFATVLPSRGRTSRLAVTLQVRVPRAAVWRPNLGNAAVTGIELLDERRTVLRSIHQEVKPLTPGRVDVSLPLTDLGPGLYRIRVAASTAAGEANREIGFLIGALSERRRP